MSAEAALDLIREPARAATLLHPLRQQILAALRKPGSAASVADFLRLPRQRVNYHLRELEKDGLVELVEERRKGNCIERIVCATARHYLIAPQVLGALTADPEAIRDRFSSTYLVALAAQAIRELSALRAAADQAGKRLATFSLASELRFGSADDRNAFAEELTADVARLVAKYHDESAADGRPFKLFLGVYPDATPTDSTHRPEEIDA